MAKSKLTRKSRKKKTVSKIPKATTSKQPQKRPQAKIIPSQSNSSSSNSQPIHIDDLKPYATLSHLETLEQLKHERLLNRKLTALRFRSKHRRNLDPEALLEIYSERANKEWETQLHVLEIKGDHLLETKLSADLQMGKTKLSLKRF